jgi:hypothetical protein
MTQAKLQPRRGLAMLLVLVFVFSLLPSLGGVTANAANAAADAAIHKWDGVSYDYSWYGNGTATTYTISTAAGFAGLAKIVNNKAETSAAGKLETAIGKVDSTLPADDFQNKTVLLDVDIDLASFAWPIIAYYTSSGVVGTGSANGTVGRPFKGVFDGGFHEINNLFVPYDGTGDDTPTGNSHGLFGDLGATGIVENIIVKSGSVKGARFTGGIVGRNWGRVENCINYASVEGNGRAGAGGIVGASYDNGPDPYVVNCINYGTVYNSKSATAGTPSAGGIVSTNEGYIQNCLNFGSITTGGITNFGGITTAGTGAALLSNNYYLNTSSTNAGGGTAKTLDEIKTLVSSDVTLKDIYKVSGDTILLKDQLERTTPQDVIAEVLISVQPAGTEFALYKEAEHINLVTATDGLYQFTSADVGDYYWIASKIGYATQDSADNKFTVAAGVSTRVNVTLVAKTYDIAFDLSDGAEVNVYSNPELSTVVETLDGTTETTPYTFTASGSVGSILYYTVTADNYALADDYGYAVQYGTLSLAELDDTQTNNIEVTLAPAKTVNISRTEGDGALTLYTYPNGAKGAAVAVIAVSDDATNCYLTYGTYYYEISEVAADGNDPGYAAKSGTIVVNDTNETNEFELEQTATWLVTFDIKDDLDEAVAGATITVDGDTISGSVSLTEGAHSYTVSKVGYVTVTDTITITEADTIEVTLPRELVTKTFTVSPASAAFTLTDSAENAITEVSHVGGTYTFSLLKGLVYKYTAELANYNGVEAEIVAAAGNTNVTLTANSRPSETTENATQYIYGSGNDAKPSAIAVAGTYYIGTGATGTLTIATAGNVILVGNGIASSNKFTNLYINCTVPGVNLTLQNVYLDIRNSLGGNAINFTGTSNTLNLSGMNIVEQPDNSANGKALIHVGPAAALTITGTPGDYLYFYKNEQGASIGGDSGEANGAITISGGNIFGKGSKQGAVIGSGAGADAGGDIRITGGVLNLIANARGALIGGGGAGSNGTGNSGANVYITGGTVTLNIDYTGAAIGGGGNQSVNNGAGGNLFVSGGSVRTFIDDNAVEFWTGVDTFGVNDKAITATKTNASGAAVSLLVFDTSRLSGSPSSFIVSAPGFSYTGGLHQYRYINEESLKNAQISVSLTQSNWSSLNDKNLYLYLQTLPTQTLTVNDEPFTVTYANGAFAVNDYTTTPPGGNNPASGGSTTEAANPDLAGSTTIEAPAATVTTSASGAVTVTTKVEVAEVAKSVAEAVKIVEAAKADGKTDAIAEVKIVVKPGEPKAGETAAKVTTAEVELDVKSVKTIADATVVVLTIESEVATITLDSATLEGIAEGKADGEAVVISATTLAVSNAENAESEALKELNDAQKEAVGENTVIDLMVTVGGKIIHDFKGEELVQTPYTPPETIDEEDYDLLTVYYVDDDGNIQEIKGAYFDPKTKQIVFKTTHFSKFMVAEWINPFSDIVKGEWYYKSVRYGVSNDLLGGIDGKFLPRTTSSRATMIVLLAKLAGIDIDGGANWYDKAIEWGKSAGITDGTNPTGNITREQLFQLLYNYSGAKPIEANFSQYTDAEKIHDWALPGMNWAIATGLATGRTATTLNATEPITRSEVVTFLQKFLTMAK